MLTRLMYLNVIGWLAIGFFCGALIGTIISLTGGLNLKFIPSIFLGMLGAVIGAIIMNILTGHLLLEITIFSLIAAVICACLFAFMAKYLPMSTQFA